MRSKVYTDWRRLKDLKQKQLKANLVQQDSLPILDAAVYGQLRADVGADAMPVLMEALQRELYTSSATIVSTLESGDLALLETTAHALKSSAASFGAMRLSAVCLKLESAARDRKDQSEIEQLLPALDFAVKEASALFGFK